MARSKEEKANWTYDYKKIRVLNYLFSNSQGGIKETFLRLPQNRKYGRISGSEIYSILNELVFDNFITERKITPEKSVYTIAENGSQFIVALKAIQEKLPCKFYLIDALKEPVDMITTRDDSLRGSNQER